MHNNDGKLRVYIYITQNQTLNEETSINTINSNAYIHCFNQSLYNTCTVHLPVHTTPPEKSQFVSFLVVRGFKSLKFEH